MKITCSAIAQCIKTEGNTWITGSWVGSGKSPLRPAHSISKLNIRNGAIFEYFPSGVWLISSEYLLKDWGKVANNSIIILKLSISIIWIYLYELFLYRVYVRIYQYEYFNRLNIFIRWTRIFIGVPLTFTSSILSKLNKCLV